MGSNLRVIVFLLLVIVTTTISSASERTWSIYSALSYSHYNSHLQSRLGMELGFRRNKYFMMDNMLCIVYYKSNISYLTWINQNGAIVQYETPARTINYFGLTYSFIPTFIAWERFMVGIGYDVLASIGVNSDFGAEQDIVLTVGYKFKKIKLNGLITPNKDIRAAVSFDIFSYTKVKRVEK